MSDSKHVSSRVLMDDDPPPRKLRTFGDAPAVSIPPTETKPATEIASAETIAPVKEAPQPLQIIAAVETAAPAETKLKAGYTPMPHYLLDDLMPTMRPAEQAVLLRLFRLSYGNHSPRCKVSMATLANSCRLSVTQTRFAVRNVEARGFVRRVEVDLNNPKQDKRGITFEMLIPAKASRETTAATETAGGAETKANKERDQKKVYKREVTCALCKDTGWYYPEGVAKGVRKCPHK